MLQAKAGQTDQLGEPSLSVSELLRSAVIETEAATFHLGGTLPLARVIRGGIDLLDAPSTRFVFTDARGVKRAARVERLAVEEGGPVRATVRLEGRFPGRVGCRFVARFCFFAGTGLVRLRLTLHNPRRVRHRGGLWDLGDPGSVLFRDLSLELGLRSPRDPHVAWTEEPGQPCRSGAAECLEIYQDSSGGANWRSRNHVNRHGQVPCSFPGYRVRGAGTETFGLRANPILSVEGPGGGLAVAVPEFWQQFPKALEVEGQVVRVRLFPGQFGDLFELQGGEQKTHTVWLEFGAAGRAGPRPLEWVHRPARIHATPEWYAASGALPYLTPALPDRGDRLEAFLGAAIEGDNSLFARREIIDEYGWRNYGEVYADHENDYYTGPKPVISHYNNQYDTVLGALTQYLRTGDVRWFELFDPLARHVVDIDIYRTDQDRAQFNGGLFWHSDHYKDAATSTHRAYSRANCPPGDRSYGGGPSNEHNYTTGLLHYYYLTGDPQARDTVLVLAEYVINRDDGSKHLLGLLDDGPTGHASSTVRTDYHGPGRGCGNSINALLDAWLLTRSRRYLDKAEALIRRSVHPDDNVEARDLLNAEARWSATVFLTALARYLGLKAEAGEVDEAYAYAQASLVGYARWMVDNEVPYLAHPERLEYVTEAWPAQEFRKANVFRLAAAHVEEPLRSRLLERGNEFSERAWTDLLRFPTCGSARALALLLTEGARDAYFRRHLVETAPRPSRSYDFGTPELFVPQRLRVRARLKTVSGIASVLLRLASLPNWWRWIVRARPGTWLQR
jgi:hypothetical protein